MKKLISFAFVALMALIYTSCQYVDIVPNDGSTVEVGDNLSFSADVEPIFKLKAVPTVIPECTNPT